LKTAVIAGSSCWCGASWCNVAGGRFAKLSAGKMAWRYMDLVTLMAAKRMQIAEHLDRNQMSEADANVAYQQAFADIVTAEKARDAMKK
jgi:hypothetical protein